MRWPSRTWKVWAVERQQKGNKARALTPPGRWRGPHSGFHAELHHAESSTSRTHGLVRASHFYFLTVNPKDLMETDCAAS